VTDETPPPRKRRVPLRWITLGEAVAVAAVIISALGLWNSYDERQQQVAEQQAKPAVAAAPLVLRASIADEGERLSLAPIHDDIAIQAQTTTFPTRLGIAPVETTGDSRIESGWFGSALVRARSKADKPDDSAGDERLGVLIETRYLQNDKEVTDRAVYDLGYAVKGGGLFSSAKVLLRGVSLVARGEGTKRIDALWEQRMKPKAK